ncbi:coiled-coil domain-containing protein [Neobacillus dielmonensis]|uniref:hypothetical protein n=1 Tax=Neobacillus dielmonensis TaxID=1347369 RepID=UPI0005A6094C|nr:hypothetical protein [Neobacillus dielmonensis]
MPRIEKVRITGVRYDKMKKHYENTIFDFIHEEEPQHALLTLVNGGGKGMLLQMMFQALMPLSTWGKNGENHIDALFYNEKQQFNPYTFHVALEWRLDTYPAEWLVTGICVTARKTAQDNDEVETEPQYFLYTSKYRKPEDWTIDTIPLYDEEKKLTTTYEEWENWLKKHKQQFQFYSRSKQNAYFQYLSSYGIEKAEWRQMKEINRDEGGIEHYFKKGLDNFGLFHHLIIPEISAYLQEDQEENLIKIFRDNSIIAQKLPQLLKREEAYQLIQEKLVPIKATLEEGQSLEVEVQEHHDRANYLYFGMEEQKQTNQFDQNKWEEDQRNTEKQQAEFFWQKDNLEYAKECRSYEDISGQIQLAEERVKELEEKQQVLETEEHGLNVDIALKDYAESTQALEAIDARIDFLEETQNLNEEKVQMEKIELQLAENWKTIELEIRDDLGKFHSLEARLVKEIKSIQSQMNLEQQELNGVRSKLGTYTNFIKAHNQKAIGMEQKYGRDVNRDPDSVQRKLSKEMQELVAALEDMQAETTLLQQKQGQAKHQLGTIEALISGKKADLHKIKQKKEARIKAEHSFHKNWCRYFLSDQEFQAFSADDWLDISEQLKQEAEKLRSQYDHIQKEYWYHQLDTSLVNGEYWVANHDVKKIADLLADEGIPTMYGTQLLQELSGEEQSLVMERYPLLAYGIVVHQQDWEKNINQVSLQTLLLHSPVPIFIRERMNQAFSLPFEIIREQGISMAFQPDQWNRWKENLSALTAGFTRDLEKVRSRQEDVGQLVETVKVLSVTTYQEILQKEEDLNGHLTDLEGQKKLLEQELVSIDSTLKELVKKMKQNDQDRQIGLRKLNEMESWIAAYKQFQEYSDLKSEAQTKEAVLVKRIGTLDQDKQEREGRLANWRKTFEHWKMHSEMQTGFLKEILPDIEFPKSEALHMNEEETPLLRRSIFYEVGPMVKSWQSLQQKIHNANSELAAEKAKREYQFMDQQQKKTALEELEPAWMDKAIPLEPREIFKERLKGKQVELKQLLDKLVSVRRKADLLGGQIIEKRNNKLKLEQQILRNHHRSSDPWAEVNLEDKEQEIEEELTKIKQDLYDQQKIIKDLIWRKQQLEKQQDILKTHVLNFKHVGEIPDGYKDPIKQEPEKLIQKWIGQNNELTNRQTQYHKGFKERLKDLSQVLQDERIDGPLKSSLQHLLPQLESDSIRSGINIVLSVMEFIQNELLKLKDDKQKAENAQEIWVDRAVYRVIRIFQSLKDMVKRMKIKNKEGYTFPLVEIERLKEIETADEEEYRRLLREHFTKTIEQLLESDESIENIPESTLRKYIDDNQLVLVSLRNRYPKLAIYKPQTTNAFLYEKPRKHHYTDWETLNKGSKVEAKGSGGQLLAARTMIMMMIMTFKRQEHNNNWSVLITDNPFGQAVSAHILDPIFSIADILRFQWIVLAPPELIKLDVSRRFPVYWKLELSQQKQGEMIREVLQHGGRTFDDVELSLF